MATILSVVSWIIVILVFILLDTAAPVQENLLTRLFAEGVRTTWDEGFLMASFVLLLLSLFSCVGAFFFNKARMRRKTDKYRKSIIITGAANFVGIIVFLIAFWSILF